MAAKLKSILRQTPWSLVLKASAVAGAWALLPTFFFIALVLWLFFVPLFRTRAVLAPFIVFLFLAFYLEHGFLTGVVLGAIFFLLMGIKDLVFLNRAFAYHVLFYLLLIIVFLSFYARAGSSIAAAPLFGGLLLAAIYGFLADGLVKVSVSRGEMSTSLNLGVDWEKRKRLGLITSAFLVWQLSLALLYIPLIAFYAAAVLFIAAVVLIELLIQYLFGETNPRKILASFLIFFVFTSLILALNNWAL